MASAWRLGDLMGSLFPPGGRDGAPAPGWAAVGPLVIRGVTADSRRVGPGYLFAALPGSRADGTRFIAEAVARGAVAVLAPEGTDWPPGVPPRPLLTDPAPRRRLALLAAALAGAQPERIVAVTGTNGKTSTVEFLRQIWAAGGERAASIGTLGLHAEGFAPGPGLTTPDPETLAATLAALARAGVARVAMEASSHGLDQCRLDGIRLAAAGFTNLTRDHLDYHADMAAYGAAKLRLFGELLPPGSPAFAATALAPEMAERLRAIATARRLALGFVGEGGDAIGLVEVVARADGQEITVTAAGRRRRIDLPLPGRFQVENALLAAALAESLGVADALSHLPVLRGVRGRMELAARLENGACAYVDYAHTPDALERLLTALRPHARRIAVVFGAGGDRDPGKRGPMGAVAARLAERAIVTDDNPRGEDPAKIRAAILAACPGAVEIGDRRAAIAAGLALLGPGDVLAVAGKGHEQGQTVGGEVIPFDDVAVVRALAGVS